MVNARTQFARFLRDDSGAVAVDWVVLTGATVGLGMAAIVVTSSGVENLSQDIAQALANTSVGFSFGPDPDMPNAISTDFSDGAEGWSGGTLVDLAGFGEVLQLADGETAMVEIAVPEGAASATVTFDLIAADDMNDDPATILINGQTVSIYRDDHGRVSIQEPGVSGITVQTAQHYTNSAMGSGSHGHDSRVSYQITVDNPSDTLTFGVTSGADDGIGDEFYAIDDVDINTS